MSERTSDYRELAPDPALAGTVACTWVQRVGTGGWSQLVLPDGCADIIFSGGNEALWVPGPATAPVTAELPGGTVLTGIRFRPGAVGHVLGLPASELRDLDVPLRELWGAWASQLAGRLAREPVAERPRLLETAVGQRLDAAGPVDPLVLAAAARLGRPDTRVAELARQVAVSERQLLRRFQHAVGYGPKTLDRIVRFRRVLDQAVRDGRALDLASLAHAAGYADQAHLTREFQRLAGRPPSAFLPAWLGSQEVGAKAA